MTRRLLIGLAVWGAGCGSPAGTRDPGVADSRILAPTPTRVPRPIPALPSPSPRPVPAFIAWARPSWTPSAAPGSCTA
jgi:hypothetical protein